MVLTRADAKAAFDHVVGTIFDSKGIRSALDKAGCNDMFKLLSLDVATIENLQMEHPSVATKSVDLLKCDKAMLKIFLSFVNACKVSGKPIGDEDWIKLTCEDFDKFRSDPSNRVLPTSPSPISSCGSSSFSMVEQFKKGIKRDPSLFPTLKDEKYNDSWHRSFETQARAQDVYNVLDATYQPRTQEEKDLFAEQNKYLFAVLESKVLTDFGKALVRSHEKDFDAQVVYSKLHAHHLKSTKAKIESSSILSYITSVRLGNGEWKGSTEAFVLHWINQVRLYERQVPSSDYFSEGQKRVMLENAVATINELRQVKNNADLETTKTGKALTFEQYSSLVLSAAAAYDNQFASKRFNHQVFSTEIYDRDNPETFEGFDIETPVSTIQAYAATSNKSKSKNPSQFVSKAKTSSLDSTNHDITTPEPPPQPPPPLVWKSRRILAHQGPLRPENIDYKGSIYNVMVEWETGDTTYEPLQVFAADDPVTCAIYAKDKNLLDQPGWKQFKKHCKEVGDKESVVISDKRGVTNLVVS
jgi:uncharacterized pyridoxamine 5'-phosphate oxidase family protein